MILQVHDELVLEVREDQVELLREGLLPLMSGAGELDVPLLVESGVGGNGTRRTDRCACLGLIAAMAVRRCGRPTGLDLTVGAAHGRDSDTLAWKRNSHVHLRLGCRALPSPQPSTRG